MVVTNVEEAWIELWCVQVQNLLSSICSLKFSKVLLGEVNEHLVLNISGSNNYHVLTIIHSFVVFDDHIACYFVYVFHLTQDWKAHHVISVYVKIDIFHQSLEVVVVCGL